MYNARETWYCSASRPSINKQGNFQDRKKTLRSRLQHPAPAFAKHVNVRNLIKKLGCPTSPLMIWIYVSFLTVHFFSNFFTNYNIKIWTIEQQCFQFHRDKCLFSPDIDKNLLRKSFTNFHIVLRKNMLPVCSYYLVSEYRALHASQDRYNNLLNFLILLTLLTFIRKKIPSKWNR
jgi:hypothetical protein